MRTDPGAAGVKTASPVRRWWLAIAAAAGFGLWWVGSVLLHALMIGVLYVASPTVPLSQQAADADFHMTISPDHVESVVAEIREQQKEEFARKVDELASVKAQLDALDVKKVEQYNALMRDEAKQAPQLAREVAAEATANQEIALQAQAVAQAAIAKMQEARSKAAITPTNDERTAAQQSLAAAAQSAQAAQDAASQAQKKVVAAQVKLTRQVQLFGDAAADARQAGKAAADAQAQAERQQEMATSERKALLQEEQQTERLAVEAQRAVAATDAAHQHVAAIEKRLLELQPPPAPVASAVSPAPTYQVTDAPVVGANVQSSITPPPPAPTATPVPTPTKQAKQEIERLTKSLPQARDQESKLAVRSAAATEKLAAQQLQAAQALPKLKGDQDQARLEQRAALDAQTNAGQRMAAALSQPDLVPTKAAPSFSPPPSAPSGADLAQLFQQAQQMETAVAESYKNVRAAELAAIRRIPLSQAMALTEVAKPVRAGIDTSILTRQIRDVEGVRDQEKTIEAASSQMNSMVALAQRMKELAQPTGQANVTVDTMKASAAHSERMEQLAAEDEGTKAKDLTAAMKGTAHADGHAHENGGNDGAMTQATATLAAAGAKLAASPLDPRAILEYQRAMATLNALATVAAGGGGTSDKHVFAHGVPEVPLLDAQHFKPIPGRTITASMVASPPGRETNWMFVDSWYMIGPWPNPERKNLDTKFPPESVIDLDATYTGGRRNEAPIPIRWRFHQDSAIRRMSWGAEQTGMIVPPGLLDFEIYYAYTELWFDEAADLWVAIGSDDQSKVWLNDQMIWKSADYYKSWAANEGLRKIHFNKGINRLLYRLENGQHTGGFSFMVCLDPKARPPAEARRVGGR